MISNRYLERWLFELEIVPDAANSFDFGHW